MNASWSVPVLVSQYVSASSSASVAATVPTLAPSAWFSSMASAASDAAKAGAECAPTVTVAVVAVDDAAPSESTTRKVKLVLPLNPVAGRNSNPPASSCACVTVCGRSAEAMAVPSTANTPAVAAGRLNTRIACNGSPSPSLIAKSDFRRPRGVPGAVSFLSAEPLGAAFVPRTLTTSTPAAPPMAGSAVAVSTASLPAVLLTVAPPDTRTTFPPASRRIVMPSVSLSAATTVCVPNASSAPFAPV